MTRPREGLARTGQEGRGARPDEALAERLADTMFALSTPSRVLILGCLLGGPRSVGDITEMLGMEQSAVSHQLRVLREHSLVRAERAGRRRLYAIFDDHVSVLLYAGLRHVDPAWSGPAGAVGPVGEEGLGGAP
ncbi:MAG TPA: metalloregulator ArsR/SmtB family transcription factor [Streptosporangiaceae bacterium]|nr:metalloregulator ArsR/SmtB family transcription factor [Streptosporangiaceae bacterium]